HTLAAATATPSLAQGVYFEGPGFGVSSTLASRRSMRRALGFMGGWSSRAQRLSCREQPGRRSSPCGLRVALASGVSRQSSLKPIDPACADPGAQELPPARATVPPSLRESSSRASTLPACSALGPLASAAQYSCRREPCTGRSAWLLLGRAC